MCPRNIHSGIDNPSLVAADWSYSDFTTIFSPNVLAQITDIIFCGTFGDPILNNDVINMCQYVTDMKPNMCISFHTNGSARRPEWWAELARAMPKNHQVVFALDGLADTHSLYRVGTNFDKVIENAKAFIAAGGNATWMFIRFKHNQHQVAQAEELSKELGFFQFTLKNTRRFDGPDFKVLRDGKISHVLEQPSDNAVQFVDKRDLVNYDKWPRNKDIDCFALNTNEIYIDAFRTVFPCCILSAFLYTNYDKSILETHGLYDESTSVTDVGLSIQKQVYEIVDELGGLDNLDAGRVGIKQILDREQWQTIWKDKWNTQGSIGCMVLCSADSPYIRLEDQWIEPKDINNV
jgi:hypothetical protein